MSRSLDVIEWQSYILKAQVSEHCTTSQDLGWCVYLKKIIAPNTSSMLCHLNGSSSSHLLMVSSGLELTEEGLTENGKF